MPMPKELPMHDLEGRVAVVTGAAGGIGEGLARAATAAGMKVVLADIEADNAERVASEIRAGGGEAIGVACDVSDANSVEGLADIAWDTFGGAHLLCNNAGVLVNGPLVDTTDDDWNWLFNVNVMGVMNGIRTFVPRIREHGQGGHIVNTASVSGLTAIPGIGIYSTTKYAVVGISEALSVELVEDDIGVSVLCPGGVDTKINDAGRNRPHIFGGPQDSSLPPVAEEVEDGTFEAELGELLQPDQVAELVFTAVRNGELYVLTHPAWKAPFHMRAESIFDAYDKAAERRS